MGCAAEFRDGDLRYAAFLRHPQDDERMLAIAEPADIGFIGDAVAIIAIGLDDIAAAIGDQGYAALTIGAKHPQRVWPELAYIVPRAWPASGG